MSLARGTSLPLTGPVISARMRWSECASSSGMTAIMNTSTPIPPMKCEKLRQNRIERGRDSTSVRMEAPVVVRPETVSKKASM